EDECRTGSEPTPAERYPAEKPLEQVKPPAEPIKPTEPKRVEFIDEGCRTASEPTPKPVDECKTASEPTPIADERYAPRRQPAPIPEECPKEEVPPSETTAKTKTETTTEIASTRTVERADTDQNCTTARHPSQKQPPSEQEKQPCVPSETEQKEPMQHGVEAPEEIAELITEEPEKPKPEPSDPLAEPLLPAVEPVESQEAWNKPMEVDGTQPGSVEQLKVDNTPASSKESEAPPAEVQKVTTESQSQRTRRMERDEKVDISKERDMIEQQRCREESGSTATKDSQRSEQSSKTKMPMRTQIVT
ncbi:hypothetical protein OSTOST_21652, partial [Ostertagia ostertagi]